MSRAADFFNIGPATGMTRVWEGRGFRGLDEFGLGSADCAEKIGKHGLSMTALGGL